MILHGCPDDPPEGSDGVFTSRLWETSALPHLLQHKEGDDRVGRTQRLFV